jgi:hypothetical protein
MQMNFGKNRVQYTDFLWTFYRYDKFDVYFYLGGKQLANFTAIYTQRQIPKVEEIFDYQFEDKIQIIIFNSLSDFKQSNIGYISEESYNTGGLTRINGNKLFLYFTGSYIELMQQIREGLSEILINQLMFGTSISSQVKNNTLLTLPDWYLMGLTSYLSRNWDTKIDDIVRDGIISGKYEKFSNLTGDDAKYAGHSFWKFIATNYGYNEISGIVHMTRVSRSIETGFIYVLGLSFNEIINEWLKYYKKLYFDDNTRTLPDNIIKVRYKSNLVYNNLRVSNDGKYAAFVSNELGQKKIWLYDIEKNKKRKIYKSGYKLDEKNDYSYPLIAWHPTGEILAYIVETKGTVYLYLYNVKDKTEDKILLQYFQKVLDFSYSNNGQLLVMSAVQNGQTDIFVYNLASRSSEQITRDIFDDYNPRFINNSKEIIFSSNRINDTIKFDDNSQKELNENNDIFIYKYASRSKILRRITQTKDVNEIFPMEYDNKHITFLSDKNGIQNRVIASFDSTISHIDTTIHYRYFTKTKDITNYKSSIIEQDINPYSKYSAEIIYHKGLYNMYLNPLIQANKLQNIELSNTEFRKSLNSAPIINTPDSIKTEKIQQVSTQRKRLKNMYYSDIVAENDENIGWEKDRQGLIKINNSDTTKNENENEKEIPNLIEKQRNYYVEYSISDITTQIDFSFLNANYQQFSGGGSPIYLNPGFNFFFKLGLSDLMEDYRIVGGLRFSFNFDNFEYLISYENLKHRLDKQWVFHRQSLDNYTYFYDSRQYTHSVYYILRWPFNTVMSIKGTAFVKNDREVFLSSKDASNLTRKNIDNYWAGLKGEFIFDNTRTLGLNLYNGTRYKFWTEYYQSVGSEEDRNLIVMGFDYRKYIQLHKTFIWANRFAISSSFGKNKLIYYMGGVDNWLFPKFNSDIAIAQDKNYTYQTLATNLRGFTQNIRNGNNFSVINSELRLPVFKYFSKKPIKSDFFNNFQIVGFGDIGTAWTGSSPWDKENSLYKKTINGNPITIVLEKDIDPIVGGFGFGFRSRLLGYFMRADWSWGIENGIIQDNIFYFSLSLDF